MNLNTNQGKANKLFEFVPGLYENSMAYAKQVNSYGTKVSPNN
jgi:hypothetical protein